MKIEIDCPQCGGNRFNLDSALSDDHEVSCADCGATIGTFALLKERIAEEIIARRSLPPAA